LKSQFVNISKAVKPKGLCYNYVIRIILDSKIAIGIRDEFCFIADKMMETECQ